MRGEGNYAKIRASISTHKVMSQVHVFIGRFSSLHNHRIASCIFSLCLAHSRFFTSLTAPFISFLLNDLQRFFQVVENCCNANSIPLIKGKFVSTFEIHFTSFKFNKGNFLRYMEKSSA